MSTLSGLLSTGMEGSSGGLLGGGLYILLEWALSSIGALLILLVLFIVSLLVACRDCAPGRRCTTWFVRPSTNTRTRRSASATKHLSSCRTSTRRQLRMHSAERNAAHTVNPTLTSRSTLTRPERISRARN